MTTAGRPGSAARSARAEASGSSGSRISVSGSARWTRRRPRWRRRSRGACGRSAGPASARTSSAVSDRTTSTWRGSLPCSAASASARSPGVDVGEPHEPALGLQTTLCAIASTSPGANSAAVRDQRRQIVPGADLRQPGERVQLKQPRLPRAARACGRRRAARRTARGAAPRGRRACRRRAPSERTSATRELTPAARASAAWRANEPSPNAGSMIVGGVEQQRVGARAVAVGDDDDVASGVRPSSSARTSSGSARGSRRGRAGRARRRVQAAAMPSAAAADWPASTGSWTTRHARAAASTGCAAVTTITSSSPATCASASSTSATIAAASPGRSGKPPRQPLLGAAEAT